MIDNRSNRDIVLVTADILATELSSPTPPVLLDVRWALGVTDNRAHYVNGHLPGARFVDLDAELAAPSSPALGRHPLPDVADLQQCARVWGIDDDSKVVVYDDSSGLAAARAWWLLRWAGLSTVRVLDGGLSAWTASGGRLETGEPEGVVVGGVRLDGGHLPVVDADAAAALAYSGVLLDARAAERYRGEAEPVDPRAGHIPGAISAPTTENLTVDGRFLDDQALTERFTRLRVSTNTEPKTVGVYCGSGVTAAHQALALAVIGVPATLFAGSWSQWSSDPGRPVAVGSDAAKDRL
ncbi:sulfurtransferase [Rhodococcus globerulus]|uniref:Sulfurtransferase n=1 Tax=Rhodococcus globerulus TaxID=33008 RepID=A0ABU4C3W2_RHOGO|nr:sulfurtransferase [Rhodococcus globerulus]MDV6271198.1 sulfurtransferase [Rhodococcus globerulus]